MGYSELIGSLFIIYDRSDAADELDVIVKRYLKEQHIAANQVHHVLYARTTDNWRLVDCRTWAVMKVGMSSGREAIYAYMRKMNMPINCEADLNELTRIAESYPQYGPYKGYTVPKRLAQYIAFREFDFLAGQKTFIKP